MPDNSLKIVPPSPSLRIKIGEFFQKVKDNEFFHPHPFTPAQAYELCHYGGRDIYCFLMADRIIGYGFLRGFDNKWNDVCLGLIIETKRKGCGELLMHFLHTAARFNNVKRIRLHVHPDNGPAKSLYDKMGYQFNSELHNGELVGYKELKGNR